jgi:colicin import membrane protein
MSYAIPQSEPGGPASVVLAFLVHLMLFSLLFFGLRWQSRNPDAVIVELWNELPPIEQPAPQAEPVPEAKPQPKPALKLEPKLETKVEPKPQKPDIAVEREKKIAKKAQPKKEPPLKFDATKRIQEQLAQEQQALRQSRERQEVLKQFAQASPRHRPMPATSTRSAPRSGPTSWCPSTSREIRRPYSWSNNCRQARSSSNRFG